MAKLDFSKGDFSGEVNAIQPVSDDYSTDGQINEFAKIDHQHPLSPTLRNAIFGTGGAAAAAVNKYGRRNLLDNGEFVITQRYPAGVAQTLPLGQSWGFYNDRWIIDWASSANGLVYPSYSAIREDFSKYIIIMNTGAAYSPAAASYSRLRQSIEGCNLQHLKWGQAAAQPLVISFIAYSDVARTIIVEFYCGNTTSRMISRAVNLAAGYAKYQVTIPGDTAQVIPDDTANRLEVAFWFSAGTNLTGGAALNTSWGTPAANTRAVGCSNFHGTATTPQLMFTGIQLEIGTIATPYEHRSVGEELQICQRYFFRVPTTSYYALGQSISLTRAFFLFQYPEMRAAPLLNFATGPGTFGMWTAGSAVVACSSMGLYGAGKDRMLVDCSAASNVFVAGGQATYLVQNTTALLGFGAEI